MAQEKKLIIVGTSAFAEVAYEYFTHDSPYDVVAFSVERNFIQADEMFGVPVVPFEELQIRYNADEHYVFAAISYTRRNKLRTRLYREAKAKGFLIASYISSRAFVWRNAAIGEHCFIFEDNTIQPFVKIGDNVIIWSGNHIGHHSVIGDNCFISSHVVISGFCNVGESCFFGVNSTIANNINIAEDCIIGAGTTILQDTAKGDVYKANASTLLTRKE
ncbi:MAG: acetyltransferase [Nitrospirae bacterium]|nr:acetyltransferase [Nitrospirota bacterium]